MFLFPNLLSLAAVLWDTVIEFYWRHYHMHKQAGVFELSQSKPVRWPAGGRPRAVHLRKGRGHSPRPIGCSSWVQTGLPVRSSEHPPQPEKLRGP